MKAYRKGARIIIIEDEFDGVSQTDIIKLENYTQTDSEEAGRDCE